MSQIIKKEAIQESLANLAYDIKILCYRHAPKIMEYLDLSNDDIFLNPMLFAYFNATLHQHLPDGYPLEQLLWGYTEDAEKYGAVNIYFDQNNVSFVPNIGYFKIETTTTHPANYLCQLQLDKGSYVITYENKVIPYILTKPLYIDDMEIVQYMNPLYFSFFYKLKKDKIPAYNDIEISTVYKKNITNALSVIKKKVPEFYELFSITNRQIIAFDFVEINSFAAKQVQGAIFSNVLNASVAYFIDDLVHQGAHNVLNGFVYNMEDLYKVQAEQIKVSTYSKNEGDSRDLFDAFHGLYTVKERVKVFYTVCTDPKIPMEIRREILARYCDMDSRYNTGLETLPFDEIYTPKGRALLSELNDCVENRLAQIDKVLKEVDFSNRKSSRFDYNQFLEINNIDKHLVDI